MEQNDLSGGIFSGLNSAMLGLDVPSLQQQQNPPNSHLLHHSQILPFNDSDHHHLPSQPPAKISYSYPSSLNPKPQSQSPFSDEDEPGLSVDDSATDGKRKASSMSPWQRMKWTDNMVRLLIMAVFYIGDEAGSEPTDPTGKKKPNGGLSQKKGKWKSVSRAMMEKGFYVSPQQCEDKFNDLNKRYKRVNDILGKGTACKVVENQNLLESMDLSPKMKEEAKKLLNSKHLFFREMCAYHNSCGHIASNSSGVAPLNDLSLLQKGCSHSPENPQFLAEGLNAAKRVVAIDEGDDEEEHEDGDDTEEDDSEEDECDHEEDDHNQKRARKRLRTTPAAAVMQQLNSEVISVMEDGGKSQREKKHWMRVRLMQLEEQQVKYQYQAFELEKQRLKWVKFSSKKEREMERSKLENERRRLENERMVLFIRQKELALTDLQQIHHQQQQFSSNKRGDPSSITG